MRRDDLPIRSFATTCQSGNTVMMSGIADNFIGHLEELQVDTSEISGNISLVHVILQDIYTPTGGSEATETRKQVSLKCGDVIHVDLDGNYPIIGDLQVNVNVSGPVVAVGVSFE